MKQLAVGEAKTRLSELLDDVERGDEVLITRLGKPVARLVAAVPVPSGARNVQALQRQRVLSAFERLAELRRGVTLDLPLRAALEAGRD